MRTDLLDLNASLVRIVDNVFPESICEEWIARVEDVELDVATITTHRGQILNTRIRNNTRLIVDDEDLAQAYWKLIKPHVDETIFGWTAHGLNERFRLYRYDPGQYFAPHYDGSFVRNDQEHSLLTVLLYLNGNFTGGGTNMLDFPDNPPIEPQTGRMLLFQHHLLHEGQQVTSGTKYVLRTDVMFQKPSA